MRIPARHSSVSSAFRAPTPSFVGNGIGNCIGSRCIVGVALAALACACDVPRPAGAYDPTYMTNVDATTLDPDAMPVGSDASIETDAGFDTEPDGGSVDADGGALDPERARLSSLNGVYFMRIDLYSKAVAKSLNYTVTSPTRVSYLYLTQVGWKDGQPKAVERLCYQTFKHECSVNNGITSSKCSLATVTTSGSVAELEMIHLDRAITVKSGAVTFTTDSVNLPLGYDAASSSTLPTTTTDPRVWPEVSPRAGLVVETNYSGQPSSLHCFASNAQNFATTISGTFAGTAAAPTLTGATLKLKIDNSESNTLSVTGDSMCSSGSGDPAPTTEMLVHFAKVPTDSGITGFGVACPAASDWDTALAAKDPS